MLYKTYTPAENDLLCQFVMPVPANLSCFVRNGRQDKDKKICPSMARNRKWGICY